MDYHRRKFGGNLIIISKVIKNQSCLFHLISLPLWQNFILNAYKLRALYNWKHCVPKYSYVKDSQNLSHFQVSGWLETTTIAYLYRVYHPLSQVSPPFRSIGVFWITCFTAMLKSTRDGSLEFRSKWMRSLPLTSLKAHDYLQAAEVVYGSKTWLHFVAASVSLNGEIPLAINKTLSCLIRPSMSFGMVILSITTISTLILFWFLWFYFWYWVKLGGVRTQITVMHLYKI